MPFSHCPHNNLMIFNFVLDFEIKINNLSFLQTTQSSPYRVDRFLNHDSHTHCLQALNDNNLIDFLIIKYKPVNSFFCFVCRHRGEVSFLTVNVSIN